MAEPGSGPDWGLGSYERTAALLLPAAEVLVDAAEVRTGERVLDLGSGTGNAALLAAGRGARVVAVDPSQRLLDLARSTARERSLEVTCSVGDAAHLPVPDASIDCVLSSFAVIFAPEPEAAAAEIARVLAPEGRLCLTAWVPGGAAGAMASAAQMMVLEALGIEVRPAGVAWHDVDAVDRMFSRHGIGVVAQGPHHLTFTATSPEAYVETELANHPMAIAAMQVLEERGLDQQARRRLVEVVAAENEHPGAFSSTSTYVVLVGRRVASPRS